MVEITVNMIMVGFGCATGWLSMALPLLQSDATPLETGKLTVGDLSWIASVIALGALCGSTFCGFIVSILGTRNTIYAFGIPQLVRPCVLFANVTCHIQLWIFHDFFFLDQLAIFDIWHMSITFGDLTCVERFCRRRRTNVPIFVRRRNCG